jgi:hypothetical protein
MKQEHTANSVPEFRSDEIEIWRSCEVALSAANHRPPSNPKAGFANEML